MIFLFMRKTAYEMRISDWSSDVCSSDLAQHGEVGHDVVGAAALDPRGVDRERRASFRREPHRDLGRGDDRVAPVIGIAPGMGASAVDDDREIAGDRKSTRLNSSH